MVKALVWLVIIFAAAVGVAAIGRVSDGYVLIVHPPYQIELSLLLFVGALLLAFGLLYLVTRFAHHVLALPGYVSAYRAARRAKRAHNAFAAALRDYYEGRFTRAEKEARSAHETGASPGVAALLAARAAHQLREFARRDEWLERAAKAGTEADTARLMTRAELALDERDFAAAHEALSALHQAGARHVATLRMLLRAERGMGRWEDALRIAEQLSKHDAIAPALAEEYRVQATVELLAAASGDRAHFEERWRRVPSRVQLHPRVASAAARHATELGAAALARDIMEKALAEEWSAALVRGYANPGALDSAQAGEEARMRIQRAEKWLLQRPEDPVLLATLGELCVHAGLWGKAQSYLEASLSFEATRATHIALARLAERLGREDDARRHYRLAADLP